jgi:hypothetical protein
MRALLWFFPLESIARFDYCYPLSLCLSVFLLCLIVSLHLTSRVVAAAFSEIIETGESSKARLG